jgi:alkylated DNA repair dioxygenase AlkB
VTLERRSAYILSGAARWNFQHSIPAVKELRYSITFRTWRDKTLESEYKVQPAERSTLNLQPSPRQQ